MGALANAAKLLRDEEFANWMTAAAAYQARQVVLESASVAYHDIRLKLAQDVLVSPNAVTDRLVTVIGTDPDVAKLGATTSALDENVILQKVAASWTILSKMMYPVGPNVS